MLRYGTEIARNIREEVKQEIVKMGINPSLSVILVGDDVSSKIYVNNKKKACQEVGIICNILSFENDCDPKIVKDKVVNSESSGVIVQLPLPSHFDKFEIINSIDPFKDVDCFHIENIGRLVQGNPRFLPCTPAAVNVLLINEELEGKHVVIVNDSIVVGKALSMLLLKRKATVTLCNEYTKNIKFICQSADILVSAVGKIPDFSITNDYVKKDAIVIDVGIFRNSDGKIRGDVDAEVIEKARWVSAVPNGIGVITVSSLLKNVLIAENMKKGGL